LVLIVDEFTTASGKLYRRERIENKEESIRKKSTTLKVGRLSGKG